MSQRLATASYPRNRRTHDDDRFRSFPSDTITVPAAVYRRRRCDAHQVVHRIALVPTLAVVVSVVSVVLDMAVGDDPAPPAGRTSLIIVAGLVLLVVVSKALGVQAGIVRGALAPTSERQLPGTTDQAQETPRVTAVRQQGRSPGGMEANRATASYAPNGPRAAQRQVEVSTPRPVARDREGRNAMTPGQREADGFRVDRRQARLTITVTEAADLLGISKTLAYALIRRREIPCIRLGRRVVVPRRALEEMVGSLPSEVHGDKTA